MKYISHHSTDFEITLYIQNDAKFWLPTWEYLHRSQIFVDDREKHLPTVNFSLFGSVVGVLTTESIKNVNLDISYKTYSLVDWLFGFIFIKLSNHSINTRYAMNIIKL